MVITQTLSSECDFGPYRSDWKETDFVKSLYQVINYFKIIIIICSCCSGGACCYGNIFFFWKNLIIYVQILPTLTTPNITSKFANFTQL